MKHAMTVAVAFAALAISTDALAQTRWGGPPASTGAMIEDDGKLFVVSGTTLAVLDAKTLNVEKQVDLAEIGKEEAEAAGLERRKTWIAQYDKDGDGEIAGEELNASRWLPRMDRNKDGRITIDEAASGRNTAPPASRGSVELLAEKGTLFMLRSGTVFSFDLKTLEFRSSAKVEIVKEAPKPTPKPVARPARPATRGNDEDNAF